MKKWKCIFAVIFSIMVIVLSYVVGNTSYPMAGEKAALQELNNWKSYLNLSKDSVPDNVLLINVAYDKALTEYYEDGMPIGNVTITDRRKLLDFLTKAREAGNYKYIMMDVILERGFVTEYDSALFHTIASMPRMVIPVHSDAALQDTILYSKAANADYSVTQDETNFSRFQFVHDDIPTMPVVMYHESTGNTIKRHGLIYTCDGRLCSNALTLKLPIRISGAYIDKDGVRERSYINLGADVLAVDSIMPVSEQIKDKIVVIGDFYSDVHRTYVGKQPGSVICMNAYYALLRGEHYINIPFQIFLFFVYAFLTIMVLNGWSVEALFKNPWLQVLASFFTLSLVFTTIAMAVYITPSGIVYNPVMPTTIFTFFGLGVNIYKKVRK